MPLYIVATPIGNLEDITLRALRILKEADLIAAEDTRRTLKLLTHYQIKNKLESYNDFNKEKKTKFLISILKENKSIALVSDSGTPGISDPGFNLIRECIRNNIQIIPVPGPNAAISALICSGLPTDKFTFYGFLPKKEKAKTDFFNSIKEEKKTVILYDSPHRIKETLRLLSEILPEKNIVIARELTKKFEEFIRGTAKELNEKLKDREIKGEIVLIIS